MRREATLLVFGAGGQLGQALVALHRPGAWRVRGLGRAAADITDRAAVAAAIGAARPDLVVNAAAFTHVDQAETDRSRCLAVNRDGAAVLAQTSAALGVPLLQVSTDYVFDGTLRRPYTEDDPMAPLNQYGRAKAEAEKLVRALAPHHVILRTSWLFGPHGRNFLRTVQYLAAAGGKLRMVADQHGNPTPAAALAAAIASIARRITEGRGAWGTFHFAGAPATTWHGFASAIVASGWPQAPRPTVLPIATADYPTPAIRPRRAVLDCARIAAAYGIAQPDWRDFLPGPEAYLASTTSISAA
jgi:dTDP-4-dehydrorhamnose reductase